MPLFPSGINMSCIFAKEQLPPVGAFWSPNNLRWRDSSQRLHRRLQPRGARTSTSSPRTQRPSISMIAPLHKSAPTGRGGNCILSLRTSSGGEKAAESRSTQSRAQAMAHAPAPRKSRIGRLRATANRGPIRGAERSKDPPRLTGTRSMSRFAAEALARFGWRQDCPARGDEEGVGLGSG